MPPQAPASEMEVVQEADPKFMQVGGVCWEQGRGGRGEGGTGPACGVGPVNVRGPCWHDNWPPRNHRVLPAATCPPTSEHAAHDRSLPTPMHHIHTYTHTSRRHCHPRPCPQRNIQLHQFRGIPMADLELVMPEKRVGGWVGACVEGGVAPLFKA
jgi:hypothetical protein